MKGTYGQLDEIQLWLCEISGEKETLTIFDDIAKT